MYISECVLREWRSDQNVDGNASKNEIFKRFRDTEELLGETTAREKDGVGRTQIQFMYGKGSVAGTYIAKEVKQVQG